ncbi:hypothetical protein HL657_09170 [Methanoculleus sp. YWC-01]|jgi:hypothetical protein|uniref:Uncharacterized protein n=1 Tax=Methanoculleus nereidis TaxID=2735141 RepID=A0ABU3Z418_9EURY|nr:hypothetical protein [Methanoculleus sp. YWC-01]MDV4343330.1 hypothetical protein [Methanoculleus sp. YWC-01]
MPRRIEINREEQEAMRARVRELIATNTTYNGIRAGLEGLGFRAKEDKPALALWESGEHELFVMVHMDPKTGSLQDCEVKTFEETEGFE